MPRGRKPLPFKHTRRSEILHLIRKYAGPNNAVPTLGSIYTNLVAPALHIAPGTYYRHIKMLINEKKIRVDQQTRAVEIVGSVLTLPPED